MSLSRIEEIYLYVCSKTQLQDTFELYAWFDHSGIPYVKMDYSDPATHADCLRPLNTWWQPDENGVTQPPLTDFPFVIYTEVHSDKPVSYLPRKYIAGKDNIIAQMPDLYKLGR